MFSLIWRWSYLLCPSNWYIIQCRKAPWCFWQVRRIEGNIPSFHTWVPFLSPHLFPQSQQVSFHAFNSAQSCTLNANFHILDILITVHFPLGSHLAPCHIPTMIQWHKGNLCHLSRVFSSAWPMITQSPHMGSFLPLNPFLPRSGPQEDHLYVSPLIPPCWRGLSIQDLQPYW